MYQVDFSVVDFGGIAETINTSRPASVDIQLKLYDIFIPLIGIFIIFVNLAIVISSGLILYRDQQPRSTYIFLGNLALSDLLTGVSIVYSHFYPIKNRNETICSIQIGLVVTSIIVSVYSVGMIAVDRYLYILNGMQYQRYIYTNRARLMVFLSWLLGIILGFLPAMGVRNDTNNGRLCWFVILTPPELVIITTTIGIIPLAVVIILYSIILRHALKKITQLKAASSNDRGTETGNLRLFRGGKQHSASALSIPERQTLTNSKRSSKNMKSTPVIYNPSKWKAIKIVLFTTGSFFITWFPFFLASALFVMCDTEKTPVFCDGIRVALTSPLAILGFFNSLLNPIIYAWWHNGFRESVKKIYYNIVRRNSELDLNDPQQVTTNTTITRLSKNDPISSDAEN